MRAIYIDKHRDYMLFYCAPNNMASVELNMASVELQSSMALSRVYTTNT